MRYEAEDLFAMSDNKENLLSPYSENSTKIYPLRPKRPKASSFYQRKKVQAHEEYQVGYKKLLRISASRRGNQVTRVGGQKAQRTRQS